MRHLLAIAILMIAAILPFPVHAQGVTTNPVGATCPALPAVSDKIVVTDGTAHMQAGPEKNASFLGQIVVSNTTTDMLPVTIAASTTSNVRGSDGSSDILEWFECTGTTVGRLTSTEDYFNDDVLDHNRVNVHARLRPGEQIVLTWRENSQGISPAFFSFQSMIWLDDAQQNPIKNHDTWMLDTE